MSLDTSVEGVRIAIAAALRHAGDVHAHVHSLPQI
jgi:hypothetical protein